ncbi:MAG: hypothetical protein C0427_15130, partial [Rhodobacter sp.]|nr:hypothetical protein [Rhodobacter sp.]
MLALLASGLSARVDGDLIDQACAGGEMPVLKPTEFHARIVWMGLVRDREAALAAEAVDRLRVLFSGPEGEDHGGLTRPSCSRVVAQYPKGTTIRNTRQFTVLSAEELADTAA